MMWLVLVAIILADQFTKFVASGEGWVSLNTGISFGLLANVPANWLHLGLLFLIGSSWVVYRQAWKRTPIAAGFFLGGALSNMIDRFLFSGVRDWLPIPGTGVANNLADYSILGGLSLLIWHSLRHHYSTQTQPSVESVTDSETKSELVQKDQS